MKLMTDLEILNVAMSGDLATPYTTSDAIISMPPDTKAYRNIERATMKRVAAWLRERAQSLNAVEAYALEMAGEELEAAAKKAQEQSA